MTSSFRVRRISRRWLTCQQMVRRERERQREITPGTAVRERAAPRDACNQCGHKFEFGDVYVSRSGRNRVYRCGPCAVRLNICTQSDVDAVLAMGKSRAAYGRAAGGGAVPQ